MNWITLSLIAYLLLAICFILDKFLLKKSIPKPAVYAFYMAILSSGVLFLIPFGVKWVTFSFFVRAAFFGIIFIWALVYFYKAVKKNEISKVAPLVGTVTQIATFFLAVAFLNQDITQSNLIGLGLLLVGGFLVSFDLPLNYKSISKGLSNSIESGVLFAISYSGFEYIYEEFELIFGDENVFINGFFWTRIGLILGGFSLLLVSSYRKEIKKTMFGKKKKHQESRSLKTLSLFLLNKISGGSSSILINSAIFMGGAVFVQALSSVQFVFVLVLATFMAVRNPDIFEEKLYFWDWAQKILAIGLIGGGIVLISL
ncbi:MAG: hypothetical protein ACWGHO_04780 [Candidatus Moraniibacteriota bacterium]